MMCPCSLVYFVLLFATTYLRFLPPNIFHEFIPVDTTKTMSKNVGTPMWMPPELMVGSHLESRDCGTAVDVFSFGVVLWQLRSKLRDPYPDLNPMQVLTHVMLEDLRPTLNDTWSLDLRELMTKCWARDPLDRPTMDEVIFELERLSVTSTTRPAEGAETTAVSC